MSAVSSVPPSRTKTLSHSCYCPPPPSLLVHCQERRPMHQSCAEDAGAHREEHMLLQRTIHLRTFVSVHNVACMSFGLCTFDLSVCRQRRQELVHSSEADRSSQGGPEELWQDAACALCTCECNGSGTLCSSRGLHAPAPRRGLRVQRHVRSVALSGSRKGDICSSSNARPRNFLKLTKAAGRQRRAYQ